jgi:hypothetical protein
MAGDKDKAESRQCAAAPLLLLFNAEAGRRKFFSFWRD